MAETPLIRCSHCGSQNRLPLGTGQTGRVAVCGRCKSPLHTLHTPITVTDASFLSLVKSSPLPVLLDMWAPWCGPCRAVSPIVDEIAAEMAGRVRVAKMNVDENPTTSSRFNVQSIPALLVLHGGQEIGRIIGAQPKQQIVIQIERSISAINSV